MSAPGPSSRAATPTAPLLEREHELRMLEEMLRREDADAARLLVVEGAAGIGKSRLLEALRDRAADRGLRVLAARGSDLEREFAFGVVRQLFEPLVAGSADRARLLGGAAASAQPVFETVGPAAGAPGADVSFAALHGLYWLTVNLAAEAPLLLVVDDLHWADRPSLSFLAYLARRLDGIDAGLAVALRTAESGTDPVLIGEIAAVPEALHVHPRPLTEAGVAELVRVRLGADPAPEFVAACLEGT